MSQPEHSTTAAPGRKAEPPGRIPVAAWLVALLMAGLLAYAFRVPIAWMVDRWEAPDSDYSHGYFVPLVVLYLVWRDREALMREPGRPSLVGLAVFLAGLLLYLTSGVITFYSACAWALIPILWGLSGFLFGWPVMKRLAFPALLLSFMVPPPLEVINTFSLRLKLLATWASVHLLDPLGVMAINDGSTVYLENGAVVTVSYACSGLRSLVSLIFMGFLFAYLSRLRPLWRGLLLVTSIPIAVLTNVMRVVFLCLVANHWGTQNMEGAVHDASGYAVFVVALAMMMGLMALLERWTLPKESAAPPTPGDGGEREHAA